MSCETGIAVDEIASRLAAVRERMAIAANHSGRIASSITLVAVTKMHPIEVVNAAIEIGLRDFGENYAQEASEKIALVAAPDIRWHFIGHLQSNKAQLVGGRCALVQTVDRVKIAFALGKAALAAGVTQDVLIQLRLGEEDTKAGVEAAELVPLCDAIAATPGVRLRGLMGIAPVKEPNGTFAEPAKYFDQAKVAFDKLNMEKCDILSLGMSGDYELAIKSGSTMVRIGSAIFGQRVLSS